MIVNKVINPHLEHDPSGDAEPSVQGITSYLGIRVMVFRCVKGRRPPPNPQIRALVQQLATRTCIGVRLAFTETAQAWNRRVRMLDQVQGLSPGVEIRESTTQSIDLLRHDLSLLGSRSCRRNAIFPRAKFAPV